METENLFLIKGDAFQAELNRVGLDNSDSDGSPHTFLQRVASLASAYAAIRRINVSFSIHLPTSFKENEAFAEIVFFLNATNASIGGQWRSDSLFSGWTSRWKLGEQVGYSPGRYRFNIFSIHDWSTEDTYPHNHQRKGSKNVPFNEVQEVTLESLHPVAKLHKQLIDVWLTSTKPHSVESHWHLAKRAYEIADNDASCGKLLSFGIKDGMGTLECKEPRPSERFYLKDGLPGNIETGNNWILRRDHYERIQRNKMLRESINKQNQAFIALGSNLGDRTAMLEAACRSMEDRNIRVIRTSALYETKPMYLEDQQNFLNGVCQVSWPLKYTS